MSGRKAKLKKKNLQKAKQQAKNSKKQKRFAIYIVAIIIIALLGLIAYNLIPDNNSSKKHDKISFHSNKTIKSCFRSPVFPMQYGLKAPYAVDLRQNAENMGLKIIEAKTGKSIQLPGWKNFGYLGLYTLDNHGNIYTSPAPYVSIDINPPKEQNKILIVDGKTGDMTVFMDLPSKNPPTPKNPFGVIGLAFDCETKSLYATSIAGSTFRDESGKVFQIDPRSRKIINIFDNHDVMGLAIFRGKRGKRLYLGMARKPEVFSVGLDEKGGFKDDLRFEFSLKDVPGGSNLKAHRIKIKEDRMTLKTREFSYTLIAASNSMRTIFTFDYNPSKDKWEFVELHPEK